MFIRKKSVAHFDDVFRWCNFDGVTTMTLLWRISVT